VADMTESALGKPISDLAMSCDNAGPLGDMIEDGCRSVTSNGQGFVEAQKPRSLQVGWRFLPTPQDPPKPSRWATSIACPRARHRFCRKRRIAAHLQFLRLGGYRAMNAMRRHYGPRLELHAMMGLLM
jgi:hypothetical protein